MRFLPLTVALAVVTPAPADDAPQAGHWSFRTPVRPPVPAVKAAELVRTPVDAFLLARLEAVGLSFAPEADKLALLRRLSFDLTGLPPTPDEVTAFVKDESPKAVTSLVDRLLDSPHYGERSAQHWLDVVRHAESNGYEADADRPGAWRYRDRVVASFNADVPFDRFVREQIAGDYLAAGRDARRHAAAWDATGLHRAGPQHVVSGNTDPAANRQEVLTEMVTGVGAAVLGLTVQCATVPRPQVRPDPAGRLLQAGSLLRRHPAEERRSRHSRGAIRVPNPRQRLAPGTRTLAVEGRGH